MTWSVLGTFALSSLILALAPGPDNIFVLTESAVHGRRNGLWVIVGLCLGICCQTLCLIVGITAFITAVPWLMILIKLCGVAYLCYLAYMAITHARAVAHLDLNSFRPELTPLKLIKRGFIMNITNPKVQLFFLSFFPQFLPPELKGGALMLAMALLGLIFVAATMVIFGAVALFAGTLSEKFTSPSFNCALNYSAALIFIALALYTLSNLTD